MAPTIITSPNPASTPSRGHCVPLLQSMRARAARYRRPKARSAAEGQQIMSVYTVYQPPLKAHESAPDPERFVFVRDGFSFWALLVTPLWLLRYRLWLAF